MGRIKCNDRDQIFMYAKTLGDQLGGAHEVHKFVQLINLTNVDSFLKRYSKIGGKVYHPRVMLSVLIYGYHRGWRSSRELQRACEENDAMRYLVGGYRIKFRAIADFRVRFTKEIGEVFKANVADLMLKKANLGKLIKADGTKIKSSAANDQTYTKKSLEAKKTAIQKDILEYLKQGIEQDIKDDELLGRENLGSEISDEEFKKVIAELAKNQKKARGKELQEKPRKPREEPSPDQSESERDEQPTLFAMALKYAKINNALTKHADAKPETNINLTDTDSKFMKRNGLTGQSYNVQAASSEGYIVAIDIATNNAENDLEQLSPIIDQTIANTGTIPSEVLVDAGYFHESSLEYIFEKDIEGFIPCPRQIAKERRGEADSGYEPHYFRINEDDDYLICPEGKKLEFENEIVSASKKSTVYRANLQDCVVCAKRNACCTSERDQKSGRRQIEIGNAADLKHAMIHKMKTDAAKLTYKKRGAEIEPIFGVIKTAKRFREFVVRGTEKVRVETKLIAIAMNFGKMIREGLI